MMGGRLQEVDLGDEVRIRNAAMTEQARRRLAGEQLEDESDSSRKRARLGKDGKPWRGRKRRASDDIKRDQMVEALMRESRRGFAHLVIFLVHSARKHANKFIQWIFTSSLFNKRQRLSRALMKPPMRGSPRNSGASLWMPWPRGEATGERLRLRRRGPERSRRKSSKGRSLVAVATRGPQCGISCYLSRRKTRRSGRPTCPCRLRGKGITIIGCVTLPSLWSRPFRLAVITCVAAWIPQVWSTFLGHLCSHWCPLPSSGAWLRVDRQR